MITIEQFQARVDRMKEERNRRSSPVQDVDLDRVREERQRRLDAVQNPVKKEERDPAEEDPKQTAWWKKTKNFVDGKIDSGAKGVKGFIERDRGFSEEQLKVVEPSFIENIKGVLKFVGEMPKDAADLLQAGIVKIEENNVKRLEERVQRGETLRPIEQESLERSRSDIESLSKSIADRSKGKFAKLIEPKTAGEAEQLRRLDTWSLFVGAPKNVITKLSRATTKEAVERIVKKELKQEVSGEVLEKIAKEKDPEKIGKLLPKQPAKKTAKQLRDESAEAGAQSIDKVKDEVVIGLENELKDVTAKWKQAPAQFQARRDHLLAQLDSVKQGLEPTDSLLDLASDLKIRGHLETPGVQKKTIPAGEEALERANRQISYISAGRKANDIESLLDTGIRNANLKSAGFKQGDILQELQQAKKTQKPGVKEQLTDAFFPMKNQDAPTKQVVGDYFSNKILAKEAANKLAEKTKRLAAKEGDEFNELVQYQKGIKTKNTIIIKKTFDNLFKRAEKAGFDVPFRKNYIPQAYNNSREEVIDAMSRYMRDRGVGDDVIRKYIDEAKDIPADLAKTLGVTPQFTLARSFPNYQVAAEYGLKPRFKTMGQLAGHYEYQLNTALSNKNLIDGLLDKGKISAQRQGTDWEPITAAGGGTGYFAPPKVKALLEGMFENVNTLGGFHGLARRGLSKSAVASRIMQEFALSGGVLKTNLNLWTFGQVIKSLAAVGGELGLTPVRGLKGIRGAAGELKQLANVIRSNFTGRSIRWFKKMQPIIDRMAQESIDVGFRIGQFDEIGRGWSRHLTDNNAKQIFGEGFDKLFNEKTFKSFAPMQLITTFDNAFKEGLKRGKKDAAAQKFAGEVTRNYQGLINAPGRSGFAKDFLTAGFFATRFRESIVNVIINTIKSIAPIKFKGRRIKPGNLFNPAFAKNRALLAGVVMSYLGYNELNKKYNNGDNLWDNVSGKELELKVPAKELPDNMRNIIGMRDTDVVYVPLMPSFLAMPRNVVQGVGALTKGDTDTAKQKAGSFFSMPIKTGTEVSTNKDYFGRQIYDPDAPLADQIAAMGSYAFFANSHPYLKIVANEAKRYKNQDAINKFKEITKLDDAGESQKVKAKLSALSKEEKQAYFDLKNKRIHPRFKGVAEGIEAPIRFTTEGSIEKQKFFKGFDEKVRELKRQEPEEQIVTLQKYIASIPEGDRRSVLNKLADKGISIAGTSISEDIIKMRPTFDRVQELIGAGKEKEARSIVRKLSDDDYKGYKKILSSERAKKTKIAKLEIQATVDRVKNLVSQGRRSEAQKIVTALSDEEYRVYKLVVDSL